MSKYKLTPEEIKKLEDYLNSKEDKKETKKIIIFNDDVNTFEHIIKCLIKYCHHDFHQAEQCALIAHYKGKCNVKNGTFSELKPICECLLQNQIFAEIQ